MMKTLPKFAFCVAILGVSLFILGLKPAHTSAVSPSEWKAGRIIDDVVFFNKDTMGVGEIQEFLNAKVPSCDTNGTQATTRWNSAAGRYYTRAEWGATVGNPAPFTCLKNYVENPTTHANNYHSPGTPVAGGMSAAQIIWNVAQQYGINPQVLIVTLQKEQGLVTDDWPYQTQFIHAMGANCPDTPSGCDPAYSGFQTQVNRAAYLFTYYKNHINEFNFNVGSNYILWNVQSSGCGGSSVNIENIATAMLYIYTPYQPNSASVAAFPGQGDGCSSYGNRNFWYYFNNWFGSTTRTNGQISLTAGMSIDKVGGVVFIGDTVTASYTIKNNADYISFAGQLGICARLNGQWYDFGFDSVYLAPQASKTISYSRTITGPGILNVYICSYHPTLGWASSYYPYSTNSSLARQAWTTSYDNPMITSGITISPSNPSIGQTITGNMTIKNNSSNPVNLGSVVIAGRNQWGGNTDFPIENDVTIPAGGTYTYSKTRVLTAPGNHTFFTAQWNGVWSTTWPKAVGGVVRQLNVNSLDNPVVSVGLALTPSAPTAGQSTTATFTLRNTGSTPVNIGSMVVAARGPGGSNVDFGLVNDVIVPAGGTYVYSTARSFPTAGTYTLYLANWNKVWSTALPKPLDGSIQKQLTLTIP